MQALILLTVYVGLAMAMPTMYTITTMTRIQIFEFANHTRLVIQTTLITILKHCGGKVTMDPTSVAALSQNGAERPGSSVETGQGRPVATVQSPHHHHAFTRAERITGLVILVTVSVGLLVGFIALSLSLYRKVHARGKYVSLKQAELDLDHAQGNDQDHQEEEEEHGMPAPAYVDIAGRE